ncbi:MAG TPA: hypothetical protein VM120_14275 [Bryobacteraceae bacterium]|nr:hypothetical protein [Bryobacteraceae bacterium]
MGQFRRKTVRLLFGQMLVWTACMGGSVDASVTVRNLNHPGEFSVTNNSAADVKLRRKVIVEKQEASGWAATDADVRLIATCEEKESGASRLLKRGETLVVKSWNGWSCDGQCPRPCRANIYLGPGKFRFVVVSSDGKQRFEGQAFSLPAQSK